MQPGCVWGHGGTGGRVWIVVGSVRGSRSLSSLSTSSEKDLLSRPWSLHSSTTSVSFGRVGQVATRPYLLHLEVVHLSHFAVQARPWRQQRLPSAQERGGGGSCRASKGAQPSQVEKCESQFDQTILPARPADRPAGRRAVRAAAAQSPRGEVVAEAPSTPHRYPNLYIKVITSSLESKVSLASVEFSESSK